MSQNKLLPSYSGHLGKGGLNYNIIRAVQNSKNTKLASFG